MVDSYLSLGELVLGPLFGDSMRFPPDFPHHFLFP